MFNPRPVVQSLPIGHGRACIVIDDALLAPERLPAFADAYREDFQPAPPSVFPGVQLRMPDNSAQEGRVAGVAPDGALMLAVRSGTRRFYGGELSLRAARAR